MNLQGMRRHSESEAVDVVVVGTGAGGAPLLMKLAQAGLRVVALEAGRNWDPAEFPADEVSGAKIYWRDERLSAGETPEAFGGNNSGTGVGGSMLHWGAFCPRPDPRDMKLRSTTGQGVDWPIEHAELIPYIEQVERFIGVSGPSPYPWDPWPPLRLPSRDAERVGLRDATRVRLARRPHRPLPRRRADPRRDGTWRRAPALHQLRPLPPGLPGWRQD